MTTAVIVQARMTSSRFPGKVLAPILDRPMLAYQLERLKRAADLVIVATTNNAADDPITDLARSMGVRVVWGPEQDVAARYLLAAMTFGVDTIVRSTADCPMIDPEHVRRVIDTFATGEWDHVELSGLPDGMGCEAFRTTTLAEVYPFADELEREHVSLYIRLRPERFRLGQVRTGLGLDEERWTVDTPADFEFVRSVFEAIYPTNPQFTLADVVDLLVARPELRAINAHVPMGALDKQLIAAAKNRIREFSPALGDL